MELQEAQNLVKISEKIRDHLLQQNAVCSGKFIEDQASGCLYRFQGKCCAIGCLITDSFYSQELEGGSINGESRGPALRAAILASLHESGFPGLEWSDELNYLLRGWQDYHDGVVTPHSYEDWVGHKAPLAAPAVRHDTVTQRFQAFIQLRTTLQQP